MDYGLPRNWATLDDWLRVHPPRPTTADFGCTVCKVILRVSHEALWNVDAVLCPYGHQADFLQDGPLTLASYGTGILHQRGVI